MPDRRQVIDYGQGRKLVLLPDQTLPYTSLTIGWPGGDQLAQEGQSGLAALTARALTRGTKDYQASELQEFLADRASAIGAHAGRQAFSVQAEFPTRFTGDVLGLLGQIINEPTWRKQELDRARDDQQALIVERQDRPLGLISREMFPFLFQSFPFNTYHLGTKEGLQDYHAAQTKSFWARQSAQPWVMAVCGQFDAQRIRKFARNLASSPVQKAQSADSGLKWGRKHELGLVLEDRNQTHLLVVFPVPGIEGQDNAGLSLLRQVLAGQGGLLFRELRDKRGLGYSVTSLLWQISQGGVLGFYIGIDPDKRDQALAGFKAILQDLRDQALPESELRRAKNMLRGNYYRSHQSLGSRSNEAADLLVRGLDLDFRRRLIDQAQDVTAKGLQDIVGKYLNWDRAYTITLSPQ
jgi:zinc protease